MSNRTPSFRLTAAQGGLSIPFAFTRGDAQYALDERGLLRRYGADVPRPYVDPLTGRFGGLLLEASSGVNNHFRYSNDLTQDNWTKTFTLERITSATDHAAARFPADNAGQLRRDIFRAKLSNTFAPGSAQQVVQTISEPNAASHITSWMVKAGSLRKVGIRVTPTDSTYGAYQITAYFDLLNGTCYRRDTNAPSGRESSLRALAPVITPYPNGWYRISVAIAMSFPTSTPVTAGLVNDPQDSEAAANSFFYLGWPMFEAYSGTSWGERHYPASYLENDTFFLKTKGSNEAIQVESQRGLPHRAMRGGTYVYRGTIRRELILGAVPSGADVAMDPSDSVPLSKNYCNLFQMQIQGGQQMAVRVACTSAITGRSITDQRIGFIASVFTPSGGGDMGGQQRVYVPIQYDPATGDIHDVTIAHRHDASKHSLFVNGQKTDVYNRAYTSSGQPYSYADERNFRVTVNGGVGSPPIAFRELCWYPDQLSDVDIRDLTYSVA